MPTPITTQKKADMSYVISATESIVPYLRKGNLVILESTSPVGTVDELMIPILEKSALKIGEELFVGHSPERVIPGQILKELVFNSRLAGGINPISSEKIAKVYKTFVKGEIYLTDSRTAELCKLAENTYRDVNIAFANELAKICEDLNINVWEAIELCNKHPRVNIHQPGPGVGGHCIAVDPWFIVEKQPDNAKIIELSRKTNDSMPSFVADRIKRILSTINSPKVTILGITYKPDVDDIRESPLIYLIDILKKDGIKVSIYDPHVEKYDGNATDLITAATGSDLLVLGVHHGSFKGLPFHKLAEVMRHKNFLDTRNFVSLSDAKDAGFSCYLLGNN